MECNILKGLDKGWKWMYRNYNGDLFLATEQPLQRHGHMDAWFGNVYKFTCYNHLFRFVKSTEASVNIKKCIDTYQKGVSVESYLDVLK